MIADADYMRRKNRERRSFAIASALCPSCMSPADRLPILTCQGCGDADKVRETKKPYSRR